MYIAKTHFDASKATMDDTEYANEFRNLVYLNERIFEEKKDSL